ncbi:hypothetical protein DX898_13510 [Bordetella bronchiseptica]|nr:hypothetical protein DX898_13510 [Bordetella bronchiseptica]
MGPALAGRLRVEKPPRCARCASLLPPRGAFALGRPGGGKCPHAALAARACCPPGGLLPWGGPAAKKPAWAPRAAGALK